MDYLRILEQLFAAHAPETLMAFFGAATSIALFYLVWWMLRHLLGLQWFSADQEADQEQANSSLVASLVTALIEEAGHLRISIDGSLRETLQRSERNTEALSALVNKAEETPLEIVRMLQPEFEYLHHEIREAEASIVAKIMGYDGVVTRSAGEGTPDSELESDAESGSIGVPSKLSKIDDTKR